MTSLVFHSGALGDFIASLPALRAWRRLHPCGTSLLLGRPAHAALCPGLFDEVRDAGAARYASLFSGEPEPVLGVEFGSIEAALLFSSAPSPLAASLAALGARGIVVHDPFPPAGTGVPVVHAVDWHLSLFPGEALVPGDGVPRITVESPAAGAEVIPGTVAIACGSGSPRKNWSFENFTAAARHLARGGGAVAWIAGPAERGVSFPQGQEVWRDLPLTVLAARLARCKLYLGNDSGVSHLAAAAGCPCVVLFGASDPAVWGPRGRRVRIVGRAGAGMGEIAVRDVVDCAQDLLREAGAEGGG